MHWIFVSSDWNSGLVCNWLRTDHHIFSEDEKSLSPVQVSISGLRDFQRLPKHINLLCHANAFRHLCPKKELPAIAGMLRWCICHRCPPGVALERREVGLRRVTNQYMGTSWRHLSPSAATQTRDGIAAALHSHGCYCYFYKNSSKNERNSILRHTRT